jgi:GT2 family glycosyltransferase
MVQSRLSGRSVDAGRHSVCAAVNADAALPAAEKNAQPPTSCEVEAEWPGVSAVVIVYNDQARVGRAIQSLQRQSYANIEIVVIDDGSTDQTQAVVQALAGEDRRIRYVRKPHSGRPQTRNVGVAEARHPWLAWLDSDDVAMPGRIARQMELAVAEPNIDILHTDGLFVGTAESTRRRRIYPDVGERFPAALLEGFADICPILNTSATIRRELYHAIGDYDADFPRCQDYDFYVRCAIAGRRRVRRVPLPLVRVELGATDNRAFYDTAIDAYARLAGKLLEGCSLTELQEQRSADLGEPPALAVARALLSLAALYKAAPEHWLLSKTFELLEQLPRGTEPKQRAIAANLAGVAHNYAGRPDQAVALYRQAVELWPGLKIAQDNLRALQSAAPAPAGNY